jgi:hypothetical protein
MLVDVATSLLEGEPLQVHGSKRLKRLEIVLRFFLARNVQKILLGFPLRVRPSTDNFLFSKGALSSQGVGIMKPG